METESRNLAVLIDFGNVASHVAQLEGLLRQLQARGRLLIKRAYGDWGPLGEEKKRMLHSAVDLIVMPSGPGGKNSADIRMVVDAMDIAHTRPYIDTFVLVSGDSDMLPLISKLRELDRYVIVVANRRSASSLLAGCCDELIHFARADRALVDSVHSLSHAKVSLLQALTELQRSGVETALGRVKQAILEIDPGFDEIKLGFKRFKAFAEYFAKEKQVSLHPLPHGQWRLEPVRLATLNTATSASGPPDPHSPSEPPRIAPRHGNIPAPLLDQLYWAFCADPTATQQPVTLSRIGVTLRRLFPEFSLRDYGYSKNGGFRKLFQEMEAENWCELTFVQKSCEYCVAPREEFLQRNPTLPQPTPSGLLAAAKES